MDELIKAWCNDHHCTKDQLAETVGVGRTAFYTKLRGTSEWTLSEAAGMARELGISVDKFAELALAQ